MNTDDRLREVIDAIQAELATDLALRSTGADTASLRSVLRLCEDALSAAQDEPQRSRISLAAAARRVVDEWNLSAKLTSDVIAIGQAIR